MSLLMVSGVADMKNIHRCQGIFNPYAPFNKKSTLAQCYRKHELEKKRAYEQRITEVQHASFTPIVLSASGGLAKGATIFYKRLATMLAEKWDQPYSTTIGWLRCTISFSLLLYNVYAVHVRRREGQLEQYPS